MRRAVVRLAVPAAAVLILAAHPDAQAQAAGPPSIAIVSRGYSQPFWQNVLRGALDAARDYDVAVSFSGPEDGSADEQAAMVRDALARRPAALCIDAVDSRRIAPLLRQARRQNIPIIGFNGGVESPLALTTASTDNRPAAALAARKLASLLGPSARVGLITADQASRTARERRDGFLQEMKRRHPGVQIVGTWYSTGDPQAAAEAAKAMVQSTPGIEGVFAADEGSAEGVLAALQELGMAGKVVMVGFDSGHAQVDAIRGGIEAGAVTQDAIRIGYKAVEAAVDALQGRRVPARIDTGFHWYDRANIDDPAISILLHP